MIKKASRKPLTDDSYVHIQTLLGKMKPFPRPAVRRE
jgi:hypothetical protein